MKLSSTREIAEKNATKLQHSGLQETLPLGEKARAGGGKFVHVYLIKDC